MILARSSYQKVEDGLMLEKLFPRVNKLGIPNDPFPLPDPLDFGAPA